jgi:hypothetical protein
LSEKNEVDFWRNGSKYSIVSSIKNRAKTQPFRRCFCAKNNRRMVVLSKGEVFAGFAGRLLVDVLEIVGGAVDKRVCGKVVDDARQTAGFRGDAIDCGRLENGRGASGQLQATLDVRPRFLRQRA